MVNTENVGGKMEIREVTEEDIESMLELDRKIVGKQRSATYKSLIGNYLGGDFGLSFIAVDNNKTVGFIMGQLEGPGKGWIQAIAVDPDYRHQDIGGSLVKSLLARYRSKGTDTVHIAVNWRDAAMLSFLNSLGFTRGDMVELEKTV